MLLEDFKQGSDRLVYIFKKEHYVPHRKWTVRGQEQNQGVQQRDITIVQMTNYDGCLRR